MWKPILMLMLLAITSGKPENRNDHKGPKCIGPFCLDRALNAGALFEQLGRPKKLSDTYCYESSQGHLYLRFTTEEDARGDVVSVFLSDFPNCVHHTTQSTESSLASWKTPEGIGIGSSEDALLKAYGTALSRRRATQGEIRTLMDGYRTGDKLPPVADVADWILYYGSSNPDDLRFAGVGLRNGTVSCLWLSESE